MQLHINGQDYPIPEEFHKATLLSFLRDGLQLTGTKRGCGTNDCGACKVLVDGQARNSCVLLVSKLTGKDIVTIEGLEGPEGLHPIQQAFIDCGAVQCGFCTPGMVITTKALLDQDPDPSEETIRQALDGNICRCTGYVKIVQAIQEAARRLRGEASQA